jgi:hypothetical protein
MSANLCQYTKTCPIFQGKEETNGTPLTIYKNVFCNRGSRGWNNCEHFLDQKKQVLSKLNNNDR